MLSLVDMQREVDAIPDYDTEYRNDMRNILLNAYTKRMISASDVSSWLIQLGFDAREAHLQMSVSDTSYSMAMKDKSLDLIGENYVRRTITRPEAYGFVGGLNIPGNQQAQLFSEWELERTLRTRRLTEAQYRKAVRNEIISPDQYDEAMRGLGYSDPDVSILRQLLES